MNWATGEKGTPKKQPPKIASLKSRLEEGMPILGFEMSMDLFYAMPKFLLDITRPIATSSGLPCVLLEAALCSYFVYVTK